MALKPQDIVVGLKLATWPDENWRFDMLAGSLGLSASEAHAAVERLKSARLLDGRGKRPLRRNLIEVLTCGVKYFHAVQPGSMVTGIVTGISAAPLKQHFPSQDLPPYVWPHPEGDVYGYELKPLYRTVPVAALQDNQLYELLVLVDAVRTHEPRPTALATKLLTERIQLLSNTWQPA